MKIAAFDYVADWFRDEHLVYDALEGMPLLPRLLGWDDDGEAPLLALEDLSGARWPPPWDRSSVDAVLAALDALHAATPRSDLPTADERQFGSGLVARRGRRPGCVPRDRDLLARVAGAPPAGARVRVRRGPDRRCARAALRRAKRQPLYHRGSSDPRGLEPRLSRQPDPGYGLLAPEPRGRGRPGPRGHPVPRHAGARRRSPRCSPATSVLVPACRRSRKRPTSGGSSGSRRGRRCPGPPGCSVCRRPRESPSLAPATHCYDARPWKRRTPI